MSAAQVIWFASLIVAVMLLPVGAIRWVIYRSGEIDHDPRLGGVALMALGIGSAALVVFVAVTVWLLVTGQRPL